MKYINGQEILMFFKPPISRLDVFGIETVDAALAMCATAFKKLEDEFHICIDFPTFKFQLLKTMQSYLIDCQRVRHDGLIQPRKRIEDTRYQNVGISLDLWPKRMQKQNAENFFLIQYSLAFAGILYRYLLDSGLPKEFSHRLAKDAALKLGVWMDQNCIHKCSYACIRRNTSNGYCTLCSFLIQSLPCPKKQEVSFHMLGIDENECVCKRR